MCCCFLRSLSSFHGLYHAFPEADIKALSGGVGVIDLEFFYTPAKAHSTPNSVYGPEGIHLYLIAMDGGFGFSSYWRTFLCHLFDLVKG